MTSRNSAQSWVSEKGLSGWAPCYVRNYKKRENRWPRQRFIILIWCSFGYVTLSFFPLNVNNNINAIYERVPWNTCEKDGHGNLRFRNFTRFLLGIGVKHPTVSASLWPKISKIQDGESNGTEFSSITFRKFGYTYSNSRGCPNVP